MIDRKRDGKSEPHKLKGRTDVGDEWRKGEAREEPQGGEKRTRKEGKQEEKKIEMDERQ